MAKGKGGAAAATSTASTKSRKKAVVRTDAQLIQSGVKGKVYLVIRKAYALATKNNFAGTTRSSSKFPNGVLYAKGKDGGSYWALDENGAEFKDIKAKAQKALAEMSKETPQYGEGVKSLVDAFAQSSGAGRSGSGLNMSSLKGLSL